MTSTQGLARDALLGIDIELPNGETVRCKALTLSQSLEFLELIEKYTAGDIGALRRILREFPKAVGADGAFEALTPGELIDVLMRFFAARRSTPAGPTPETPSPSESTT